MTQYDNVTLWQNTLAPRTEDDPDERMRERLRVAYEGMRERAEVLAAQIAADMPNYTKHDISHSDSLWIIAETIAGRDYRLTPTEAFVLGGAFLIHDLGMALTAYTEGIDTIKEKKLWNDKVTLLFKKKYERLPQTDELAQLDSDIEEKALEEVLRELHAEKAQSLLQTSWVGPGGNEYYLIDNPELREAYGAIIGQIAYSHWWSVDELRIRFTNSLGSPSMYNNEWIIDPIKLACLLRAADIAHIDDSRAPSFLRATKSIDIGSEVHWTFQNRLYQPRPEVNRLTFTAKSAFSVDEATAWWQCYDALKAIDNELRQIDALLSDTNRDRFFARGVSGIEEVKRLIKLIPTDGWEPVDTKIHVSDVAGLVQTLGGEKLYGRDNSVPLRELIQNASDAVRARRLFDNLDENWGDVIVRVGIDEIGKWVEVEDTGIGMSSRVLTGPFLDFSTTFWGTALMHSELPGLEAKGFTPTGEYGIGFFSVFMWGERVKVITRRPDEAREDTRVLEFKKGLLTRPLLRRAQADEIIRDGGTTVRIWLDEPQTLDSLLSRDRSEQPAMTLSQFCAWLCPSLDVNLKVQEDRGIVTAIAANDWTTLNEKQLIERITGGIDFSEQLQDHQYILQLLENNIDIIRNKNNQIIARACIMPWVIRLFDLIGSSALGVVTVGGLRSSSLTNIAGIFVGRPHTASRQVGIPIADYEETANWAEKQIDLLQGSKASLEIDFLSDCAQIARALGSSTKNLPIAYCSKGWISAEHLSHWDALEDEIILVSNTSVVMRERESGRIELQDNVFAVEEGIPGILQTGNNRLWTEWPERTKTQFPWYYYHSLSGALLEAIADYWEIPLEDIWENMKEEDRLVLREIGTQNGYPVKMYSNIVKRYD